MAGFKDFYQYVDHTRVIAGRGLIESTGFEFMKEGADRVFIVTDEVIRGTGLIDKVQAGVEDGGLEVAGIFDGVPQDSSTHVVEECAAAAKEAGADSFLAVGGGSVMDTAKVADAVFTHGGTAREQEGFFLMPREDDGMGKPLDIAPLACIPTTAGTGSEVGTRALITDPATMNKIATESVEMLADIAIIDPSLTVSVPPVVTAATGVDAMAHCVEAFTSKRAHPIIDAYALQGIELVGRYLGRAVKDGTDIEARAGLALAAFYGGVCLGPVNTTAGHAIAYPLGTRHKLAHGIANALIFPHVLAVNAPAVPEKTALVGRALGFGAEGRQQVLGGAREFCRGLGLDMALRGHGVPHDDLPASAREAHAIRRLLDWNPVDLSEADILEIYEAAY
jgi:alcohol dehydrogenase class IV